MARSCDQPYVPMNGAISGTSGTMAPMASAVGLNQRATRGVVSGRIATTWVIVNGTQLTDSRGSIRISDQCRRHDDFARVRGPRSSC